MGSFFLEIFWLISSPVDVDTILPVIGAMKHLVHCYNASVTLITSHKAVNGSLAVIADFLGATLKNFDQLSDDPSERVQTNKSCREKMLWKGNFLVQDRKNESKLHLPGFSLCWEMPPAADTLDGCEPTSQAPSQEISAKVEDSLTLSWNLEMVQTVLLQEIPQFLVSPLQYKLCLLPCENNCNGGSRKFMQYLLQSSHKGHEGQMGVIARLPFSLASQQKKQKVDGEVNNSRAWKTRMSLDPSRISVPEFEDSNDCPAFYFLLFGDGCGGCVAHPLHPPHTLNAHVLYQLANCENFATTDTEDVDDVLLAHCPSLDEGRHGFLQIHRTLGNFQLETIEQWKESKSGLEEELTLPENLEELHRLLVTVSNEFWTSVLTNNSSIQDQAKFKSHRVSCAKLDENCMDPSSWPELIALKGKKEASDKMKRQKSEDMYPGRTRAAAKETTSQRWTKEILQRFDKDGRPANLDQETLSPLRLGSRFRPFNATATVEALPGKSFSEAIGLNFHGISYCLESDDSVAKDKRLSEKQSQMVVNETASLVTMRGEARDTSSPLFFGNSPAAVGSPAMPLAAPAPPGSCRQDQSSTGQPPKSLAKKRSLPGYRRHSSASSSGVPLRRSPRKLAGTLSRRALLGSDSSLAMPALSTVDSLRHGGSRAEKNKRRLQQVVESTLRDCWPPHNPKLSFPACAKRLFEICLSYLKDRNSSHGLLKDMTECAQDNAMNVIKFEEKRLLKK